MTVNEEMACLKWPHQEEEEVVEMILSKRLRVYVVVDQLFWILNEKVADEITLVQYERYADHHLSKDNIILMLLIVRSR